MLGLGPTEILLVTVAAAVLIGPKDVPRLARAAGIATGRATALLVRTRRRAFEALEAADVAAVRGDLYASARQLESIRSELRSGMRFMEPPPPAGASAAAAAASPRPPLPAAQPRPSSSSLASAPLPFSAASLGRAPARAATAPTGSDVLADALAEEEVARLGAQVMGGGVAAAAAAARPPRPRAAVG